MTIGSILSDSLELAALIGDGPIFSTYTARDLTTGRDVCVRLVKADLNGRAELYDALREVQVRYGAVRSAHVEGILQVGQDGESVYTVTDLTRGPNLAERIRKLAPFSIPMSVSTAISICQALDPIHRAGLAHGDLAPQNIAVLANGDVRLQLAGVWEAYGASPSAGAAVLPGMAPYLAPEISSGAMPSPIGDVYALGTILYELLSGRLPYFGANSAALAAQHAQVAVPRVREINPAVPIVLDEIVRKAMSKDPSDRYTTAGDLLDDLRLMQDALRFGRSLSWPIRPVPDPRPAATKAKPAAPAVEPVVERPAPSMPVAPRMSAIRTDEEYASSTKRPRAERDVPAWMTMTIVFLAAVVLSLIGFWMMMNVNRPQLVGVPNIVGLSSEEAREVLKSSKLQLRVGSRVPNERVKLDEVLSVEPEVGVRVREGSQVSVKLSAGSRYVELPDLKGLTIDKARTILGSLNLGIDAEMIRQGDDSLDAGLIVKTVPGAKSKVERNTRIKFVVSAGSGGAEAGDPESGYLYRIRITLDDLRDATAVRIEMRDKQGTRSVYDEVRNPGDLIDVSVIGQESEATFDIYYNDERVKEEHAKSTEPS